MGPYHLARLSAAAAGLASEGIRVVGIELAGSESSRDWLVDRANVDCEIRTLSSEATIGEGSSNFSRRMLEELNELNPDYVALAGYDRPEMRAALGWTKRHSRTAVLMSETKWDDRPRKWWKMALLQRFFRKFDAALVSGAASCEYLVSMGIKRERIFWRYGVIDNDYLIEATDRFRLGRNESKVELPEKYFLACSRLIENRKNICRLLSAFAAFRHKSPTLSHELIICGDGPDRQMQEEYCRAHGINGVSFVGFQQMDSLAKYYAHASCFVHPAINEAWGLVINEAMAAALPILISRRVGCAYDLVRPGVNGFTFDPYDVDELAGQLLRMATMSSIDLSRMGAASREMIQNVGPQQFSDGLLGAIQCAQRNKYGR